MFLNDTTTRRNVLADSTAPLVTVRSASEQLPDALASPPPPSPPLGGPSACAVAAKPSVTTASTNPAVNVPDGFMILQLLMAFGRRVAIKFGTLRLILGAKVVPIDSVRNFGQGKPHALRRRLITSAGCSSSRSAIGTPSRGECRLMRSQDDDRIVDLFERFERLCRNAEDGGQHPGWKPAEGLTYADVVFGFGRTGVLDDHYFHVARATVLEVVERSLGCEHDVVDVGIETLVVAVPVDEDPGRDSLGDQVDLPRAGMPVWLANTPGCNVISWMLAS